MSHKKDAKAFKVESKDLNQLAEQYPRDEKHDHTSSMEAYIIDMHSQGWEFIQAMHDGYGYRFFFKAV